MNSLRNALVQAGLSSKVPEVYQKPLELFRYQQLITLFSLYLNNAEQMGLYYVKNNSSPAELLKKFAHLFKDSRGVISLSYFHYRNICKKQGFKLESNWSIAVDYNFIWKFRSVGYTFCDMLNEEKLVNFNKEDLLKFQDFLDNESVLIDTCYKTFM